MNPEKTLHLVPETHTSPKPKTKKEMLLALAQKISQQNAENVNEMFEILKMED